MDNCPHLSVTIHSRLWAMQTLTEPAEYIQRVQCDNPDCCEWMDTLDIPEEAVEHDA